MASPNKITTTYRLTPELDKKISQQAESLGISKNAFVQMTLTKAVSKPIDDQIQAPTGTDG